MKKSTLRVPSQLHEVNRHRLCSRLKSLTSLPTNAYILLQGGSRFHRYCTSAVAAPFRQESFFHWTFGVLEPDTFGAIHVDSGETTLFFPRLLPDDSVRCGP